jgi:hypothetical protein
MMRLKVIAIYLLLSSSLFAVQFSGMGVGKTKSEAKKEALADLSFSMKSEVKSSFKSVIKASGEKVAKKMLKVSSQLPILGSECSAFQTKQGYQSVCELKSEAVLSSYMAMMKELNVKMKNITKSIEQQSRKELYRSYVKLLALSENYERYYSVYILLGGTSKVRPFIDVHASQLEISKLSEHFSSLKDALLFLTKDLRSNNIFIFPPKAEASNEITPFAKIVKKHLLHSLDSTVNISQAQAYLKGEYILNKRGMSLSINVLNTDNKVLFSNVVHLDKEAYEAYEIEPKNIDFDTLLHQGLISKSKMKARLKTSIGDEDLLFVSGDSVELFVKLNNPGYFYIVGHVEQKSKKFSYLVDMSEVEGETKFIQYVDGEDANKWMLLGAFDVEAPFGVESMQLIASNKKIKQLPQHYFDKKSGYNVLGKDPSQVAITTRGLKKKMSKKAEVTEAVLMFSSMEK